MNFFKLLCIFAMTAGALRAESPKQYEHCNQWVSNYTLSKDTNFKQQWTITVGEGRSQVISGNDRLYVLSGEGEKRKGKPTLIQTRLLCLDQKTGEEIWRRESEAVEKSDEQESFSGATPSPRATPALIGDSIITVNYSGTLECVDADSGDLSWKHDMVADLGATPVQFGFSSSPVCHNATDRFFVTAAGPEGGLYCLSVADGSTIWKAECGTFSYATPTFTTIAGVPQIIAVTRNEIIGVDESDGSQLWSHPLAEKGLTNVPSPIVLEDGIVISGQGCKGTRRLEIAKTDDAWTVSEKWHSPKIQFFYSNWSLLDSKIILGVDERLLVAIDVENGSTLGKWRGFRDGNLVLAGDSILVVDGKGSANVLTPEFDADQPGFTQHFSAKFLAGRCWTPPTIIDGGMLLRGNDKLTMIRFSDAGENQIANKLKESKFLPIRIAAKAPEKEKLDYVAEIFETFETDGQNAALKLYNNLRKQKPSPLSAEDRIALVQAAEQQGLDGLAKMITQHAIEDFPNSKEIQKISREQE